MRSSPSHPPPTRPLANAPIRTDRQQAILQAAERLFAGRGYHGVGIRQIADAAQVPLALVGYYYGSKQRLFLAVFSHWSDTHAECLAALDAAASELAGQRGLRRIVEAFALPMLRLRHNPHGSCYARLLARELVRGGPEAELALSANFDPLTLRFARALQAALPQAPRSAVVWATQFALGALVFHLSDERVSALSQGHNLAADPAATPALVRFIEGGIRATLEQTSNAALDLA